MGYEKLKKKKRRSQILRSILVLSLLLLLIFRSVPSILANNARTILPEKGDLIDTILGDGIVIKKEEVFKAQTDGLIEKIGLEGARLSSGSTVLVLNSENDSSALKQELEEIEESITALKESENEIKVIVEEKDMLETAKFSLAEEIQDSIKMGNFEDVYLLKEKIFIYNEKTTDIDSHLLGTSLENLEKRKEAIRDTINTNHIKYYTPYAGVLSYEIDGYEEVLLAKEFTNYTYEELEFKDKSQKNKEGNKVVLQEPIFKLIDNFEWYIAIKIKDLEELDGLEVKKGISLIIEDMEKEIRGQIVEINKSDKGGVVVVSLNTLLHDYYKERFLDIKIIKSKKEGYKIPSSTIIDNNGIEGVYIKEKNGIVKFRPVIIIGKDRDYTYVDTGDLNGNISLEAYDKPIKTIGLFDDIFSNTKNIKEGQILN